MKKLILLSGTLLFTLAAQPNDPPDWWHNVVQGEPADYAPANQGQLKFIAQQAHLALQTHLPHADLSPLDSLIDSFTTQHNHQPVNLGQLKWVAAHFYDFFQQNGLQTVWPHGMNSGPYPWTPQTHDDQDHAPANLGQLKYVFSFNLTNIIPQDEDQDGLPDAWEIQHLGSTNYTATDDNDMDGLSNRTELLANTDPAADQADRTANTLTFAYNLRGELQSVSGAQPYQFTYDTEQNLQLIFAKGAE
jgi:hypothetical protein